MLTVCWYSVVGSTSSVLRFADTAITSPGLGVNGLMSSARAKVPPGLLVKPEGPLSGALSVAGWTAAAT